MKTMEIKALGLEEVSINEIVSITGGVFPWWPVLKVLMELGDVAMGMCAGMLIYNGLQQNEVEEYYGGELDAAVCIG